ncbi:MAG: VanZ family protein [Oscillospiraceae bacterium]|nr:VanZ family protein [Oscillospiraceae bacterium]
MKVKHWLWIFVALSLLTVAFIWGNSLKSIPESAAQSSQVAESVRPVLDPQEKMEKMAFHDLVRKFAHVVEFLALGLFVGGFAICLGLELKKRFVSLPMLIALLVAVGDEFIQHFTKRGSLVTDVALDFAGALAGLLLAAILYKIIQKIKKK